jgi:hypothetical protein
LAPVVRPPGLGGRAAGERGEGWASVPVKAEPANWLPRSAIKMSGLS